LGASGIVTHAARSTTTDFLRSPISNGNASEQALIRRWWYQSHGGRGRLVWEYYLEGRYLDAVWFPMASVEGEECSGDGAPKKHPIKGVEVVLCEAKADALTPALIGQALVHRHFAIHGGAVVRESVVFVARASDAMLRAASHLGLTPVVSPPPECQPI
jgi:hypothetical protein